LCKSLWTRGFQNPERSGLPATSSLLTGRWTGQKPGNQDNKGALESGIPARGLMPVSGGSGKTIKPGAISRALSYLWFCLNNSSVVSCRDDPISPVFQEIITITGVSAPVVVYLDQVVPSANRNRWSDYIASAFPSSKSLFAKASF
jgi:hypothetical protein